MENRTTDMIHHPGHYTIKYLYRYPKKGTLKSDLMKAEEYTKFLRELFTR